MGDPDLSADGETSQPSVAELIREGDAGAIAGFRDAHLARVSAYCAQLCRTDLIDETSSAAFVDFLARMQVEQRSEDELDELLLRATRAAAAGRTDVGLPPGQDQQPGRSPSLQAECAAMPELLAALANAELPGDERPVREHLDGCRVCEWTVTRMERAELLFEDPSAELPELEISETVSEIVADTPEPPASPGPESEDEQMPEPELEPAPVEDLEPAPLIQPEPPASAEAEPEPEPGPQAPPPASSPPAAAATTPPPLPPIMIRRRSGGLVGAIRNFGRSAR